MKVGDRGETKVKLAGGMSILVTSVVEDGPAVRMSVAPLTPSVPLFLQPGGFTRRMEMTLASGIRFWVMQPGEYRSSVSGGNPYRQIALVNRLEDDRPPVWVVFTDGGQPSVT